MSSSSSHRKVVTVSDAKLASRCARGRIVVIDDDAEFLSALFDLFDLEGYACEIYTSALAYLHVLDFNQPRFAGPSCVICDVRMPEVDGLELQQRLVAWHDTPLLLMSGSSGAQEAARAFRAGALDFLVKPIDTDILLEAVSKALKLSTERQQTQERKAELARRVATLTERERDVARRVASGQTNPAIADELGISLRSVKRYRQNAVEKVGAAGTADLVRIADEAGI